jgi:hypothetical protein
MDAEAVIWTEGKTDWQHIKRAFQVLGVGSRIKFQESGAISGDDQLLKQCQALAHAPQSRTNIFVFDRDHDGIVRVVEDSPRGYKAWGNNVYSLAIPIPAHRSDQPAICIEFYYSDEELRTSDSAGRRLFLTTEFNPKNGRHVGDPRLSVGNKGKLSSGERGLQPRLLDSDVYDEQGQSVALSKALFAKNVSEGVGPFSTFSFEPFRTILTVIESIIAQSRAKTDLPFGGIESFFTDLDEQTKVGQFKEIVDAAIRACKLTAMTFAAATLRHYEQRITDESGADTKRVRPIKELLATSFGHPSLSTLLKLARYCYHLVDEHAPGPVYSLRAVLAAYPKLETVGDLLDDLERVFPPSRRLVNKSQIKKPVIDYLIPELAKYESKLADLSESASDALQSADPAKWRAALSTLLDWFAPIRSLSFRVRRFERVRNDSEEFEVRLTCYRDDRVHVSETSQLVEDLKDNRLETYELLVTGQEGEAALDLFPFLVIKDDHLHYYRRNRAHGYEYDVVFGSSGHLFPTKRKFSHAALRSPTASDRQALFFAQVTPTKSQLGVRANFPAHDPIVGRKQQIGEIMEDIIQIPNQNGILQGPGGVGKTALLIELSRQLFEEEAEAGLFKNIIWVSAKRDYYDAMLDVKETKEPQFRTLENVLAAMLEFFGFDDPATYPLGEKKGLVFESLQEQKTLLILDNFESVGKAGQQEIIRFFGVEAKRALRDKPDYFKVLVTSREQIVSGFHQYSLRGLDKRESKQLMQRLYEPYARSGKQQLSVEQMDNVYEATQGIPLIIKHCYGQVYEYNCDVNVVLKNLRTASSKPVEFSFAEVLCLLKQDELQLRTILLLELSGRRLTLRQMADILGAGEPEIAERLSRLVNFQCVNSDSTDEKYAINDEARVLTRRLPQQHAALATEVKQRIASLSIEQWTDYSQQEHEVVLTFQDHVAEGHYLVAEDFMSQQLKEQPGSVLLNLHYARFLKEIKGRTDKAIHMLEQIRQPSGNDPQVLRLLMTYYTELEIPNFEQAHGCAREIENVAAQNKEIRLELARFYVAWSLALKMKSELDPIRDMVRQQKYKDLADTAVGYLKGLALDTHQWHYLLSQAHFNRWDNQAALLHVDRAIAVLPSGSHLKEPYVRLRREILKKRDIVRQRKRPR